MNTKLTLSLEESLIKKAKDYARSCQAPEYRSTFRVRNC